MKELADGTKVVARMYYYLLDFNDTTGSSFMRLELKKNSLHELNKVEFMRLFKYATEADSKRY